MATGDHIAALTDGQSLPLAPVAPEHLEVILEAVTKTWSELLTSNETVCANGDEKAVNALLEPRLNTRFQTDPNYMNLVSSVVRGKETVNFNGTALEKKPDLSLMFAAPRHNFPLVIECKIIDQPNKKTAKLYCDKGLARFIDGTYAWATREAIMLAYVRDGSSINSNLRPHLVKSAAKSTDPLLTQTQPQADASMHPTAQFSTHGRSFPYTGNLTGSTPGPITLWHLWLT